MSRHVFRMIAATGPTAGLGIPASLALLLPMEAGVPIPIPADLVMLVVGERVAAGRFPLWAAVLALEVVTVVAAGASGVSGRRAIPALAIGASVFLQLHLVLGYALGPAAADAFDRAKGPMILVFVALLVGAAAFWVVRRGRRAGTRAFTEAACPLCLTLGWLSERPALDGVIAVRAVAAESRGGGI